MIIFWIGFTIMFLNEGFVIMRHVHPWFAEKRQQLHNRFGEKQWKRVHGYIDWAWIILIGIGVYLDYTNWLVYVIALGAFWGTVLFGVYVPMLWTKLKNIP